MYTASTSNSPLNAMKSSPNLGMSGALSNDGYDNSPSARDYDYAPRYGNYGNENAQAPPRPAKIPLGGIGGVGGSSYGRGTYQKGGAGGDDLNALAEEMKRIDIGAVGASGRGRIPRGRMLGYN
jgi:hypothetical protein